MPDIDDSLELWPNLAVKQPWGSLILGNGFSQHVWQNFHYPSLFERACDPAIGRPLNDASKNVFTALGTPNFEVVLSALHTTRTTLSALGQAHGLIDDHYEQIRNALIDAVHSVHIPWLSAEALLKSIAGALCKYNHIFSTNYDLLVYWAVMSDPDSFKDYFWSESFDLTNTAIWDKITTVHYLHGGLHLYRRFDGQTLKRPSQLDKNLLALFATPYRDALPLFISEGTAAQKLATIFRSEYLSFVFSRFSNDETPLVIFGHGLGEQDSHLVKTLQTRSGRKVAISVRRLGDVRAKKAALIAKLPKAELYFFDAATHPLGDSALTVAAA